jgi:putative addiction module component (TIGR02574 family)
MAMLSSDEIVRLSPTERLSLIAQLWDSLEQHHLPLSQAQEAELDRRLAAVEEDGSHGISWPSLKSKLEQRRSSCSRSSLHQPLPLNSSTRTIGTKPSCLD